MSEHMSLEIIIQSGVMSKVVELLHQSADVMILTPALRTAGNIVTGSDSQTEAMINLGLLNVFPKLLRHNKPNIVKVRDEIHGPTPGACRGTARNGNCYMGPEA